MLVEPVQLSHCALPSNVTRSIAMYKGQLINNHHFSNEVKALSVVYADYESKNFALFFDQAYPFSIHLFALLHSQKKIYIANNNTDTTAHHLLGLGCTLIGDWDGKEIAVDITNKQNIAFNPINAEQTQLFLFTSGSTGQPKAIKKTLLQFQREINTLESCWGQLLGQSQVLATVSHQHIYGLLFRILWPLVSGRCFNSNIYLTPEPLLQLTSKQKICWISSPAQLKRLDEFTEWQDIAKLTAIFSSGGLLPIEVATQIIQQSGQKVVEIYGSTETGGIAWRCSADDAYWRFFDGVSVQQIDSENYQLNSPFLTDGKPYHLDDKLQFKNPQQFKLIGRKDRIVKIEEKRLSLDQMEQHLNSFSLIKHAYTLFLADKRDKIAAVIELIEPVKHTDRVALIKSIKQHLAQSFETVVWPRKWIFISAIPVTTQSKVNSSLLLQLCSLPTSHYPKVLFCDYQLTEVELQLQISAKLVYFSGHFPDQPILPGVTQLAWVEKFGKIFFNISQPFFSMEVIKFKKIIQPGGIVKMKLRWKKSTGKLYFELISPSDLHSSGRLLYDK